MLTRFYYRSHELAPRGMIDLTDTRSTKLFPRWTSWRKEIAAAAANSFLNRKDTTTLTLIVTVLFVVISAGASCTAITQRRDVRPLVLRDVPAQNLGYRF